jgi:tRNA-modifying protein YgfZ
MIPMNDQDIQVYLAARKQAAFRVLPQPGAIHIGGDDRAAFLQRQTTNDVHLLQPGRAVLTVLTSPTARILDVFYLLFQADRITVLTLPGQGEATARYLRSRIFFMDKIVLDDVSAQFAQIDLLGPEAAQALKGLGLDGELAINQAATFRLAQAETAILALEPAFGLGYRLVLPVEAVDAAAGALAAAGMLPLTGLAYQALRLEAGIPAAGAELTEAYTPLETGLLCAVSDRKGCYTGQEVIARQITYDKVTQSLCGLKLAVPAATGARVWTEDDRAVGQVTSVAHSPRSGEIALAVLKRPYDEPGRRVWVGEQQASGGQEAVVSALPFA